MLRTMGWLILVHAVITAAVWAAPLRPDAPFNPGHSWLLGDCRPVAAPAGLLLALGLAATGIGLLSGQPWWAPLGLATGAAAAIFVLIYFNPWLCLAVAINTGIAITATSTLAQT